MPDQPMRRIYQVYYRHHPLEHDPATIPVTDWLLDNGSAFALAAVVEARSSEEAMQAIGEKRARRGRLARFVDMTVEGLRRDITCGDVILDRTGSWVIATDLRPFRLDYPAASPHKVCSGYLGRIQAIAWSPDGRRLAAADSEGHVQIHEVSEHHSALYTRHESSTVLCVAWSPDHSTIASGDGKNELHLWTADTHFLQGRGPGRVLICRGAGGIGDITCVAWAPDSRSIVTGRADGAIFRWDAQCGACLDFRQQQQSITSLSWSPAGRFVASSSRDGTARVWQPDEKGGRDVIHIGHGGPILSLSWSPDGALIASAGVGDRSLHLWNPRTGEDGLRIPLSTYYAGGVDVSAVAWSPDGKLLAAAGDDGILQIVDLSRARHVRSYREAHDEGITHLSWSPDGQWLASSAGGGKWDYGRINLWARSQM